MIEGRSKVDKPAKCSECGASILTGFAFRIGGGKWICERCINKADDKIKAQIKSRRSA